MCFSFICENHHEVEFLYLLSPLSRVIFYIINDYLEQQLQLLYDYWFTQYNFPNEDGQPYKASNGLMVWNKMINHLIPADWKVKPLGTICSFRNGINYDKNVDGNTIYKIINVRNISSSTLFLNESTFDEICLPSNTVIFSIFLCQNSSI